MAAKRGNGEGSRPRKRPDGRWEARYTVHTSKGPKRKTLYGRTRQEVADKLARALSDRTQGLTFEGSSLKLGEYLDRWLPDIRDMVRQRTWERYEQIVRVHLKPALGRVKLKDLTAAHARLVPREVGLGACSSHSAVHPHHAAQGPPRCRIRRADPPQRRRRHQGPKAQEAEINPLSPAQARAFLEGVRGDRLEALYSLAIHRGLRQGELLGLRWEDVDLEVGKLQVQRTLSLTSEGHLFEPPKNGKGRSVELTQGALDAISRHLTRQLGEIEALGDNYEDQGLIFPGERGQPMRPYTLTGKLERTLGSASLPRIRFHDLRHTCATLLLSKGVHPKFVQELLGHATISITLDRYSHVIPAMGDQTKKAMEDVLS